MHSASSDILNCWHLLVHLTYAIDQQSLHLQDGELLLERRLPQTDEEGDESSTSESGTGVKQPWLDLYHERKQQSKRARMLGKVHVVVHSLYMTDEELSGKKASLIVAIYAV